LLEQFFGTASLDASKNRPWRTENVPRAVGLLLPDPRKEFAISFLIETVPAASSASLRHQFDSYLNAIQMAAGRAGYVLDSFDVPWLKDEASHQSEFRLGQPIDVDWNNGEHSPLTNPVGKATAVNESETQSDQRRPIMVLRPDLQDEHLAENDSAVLLFREDSDSNKRLLVVFLVDETPVRGINKARMDDALDQIAWLSGWKTSASPPPQYLVAADRQPVGDASQITADPNISNSREIRIVGPVFSGSAMSLRNTLTEWLGDNGIDAKISILSGTATAIGDKLRIGEVNGSHIQFDSVRISDSAIWQFARPLLHAQAGQGHPRLAVLTDSTSYGGGATGEAAGVLRITFPVHISHLRNTAGQAERANTLPGLSLGRHDIPIADDGQEQEKDVIPLLSSRSPTYDELVLENLLATLSTEHVRYIGIVATDVEDLVFLVHEVRQACPNTVVFTTSADLRYLHSDVNPDLVGMLVFSTYPLFGWNQLWTYPFTGLSQRIQFSGEDAEGVFNATVAQLDHSEEMEDYGVPFITSHPPQRRTPVLWVGVVGHDAIWPVGFHLENGIENLYAPPMRQSGRPAPELVNLYPLPLQTAFLIICLGCLIPAGGMLWPRFFSMSPPSPGSARSWPLALFGDAVFPEFHRERWMRVSAFLGALLIAMVVAVGYFLLPLRSANLFGGATRIMALSLPIALATILAVIVTIPALLAAIAAALRRILSQPASTEPVPAVITNLTPTGAQFALFGTAVGFVLVTIFVMSQWWQKPDLALLNFIRAANLGNGVSPLTPLIFLGVANLCLIGGDLWRLRLIEDCRLKSPFLNFEAGAQSMLGTDALEAQVIHFLECSPWEVPGTWWLIALLTIAFTYFSCSRGLPMASIDGWTFSLLFFLSAVYLFLFLDSAT
jgi:hypothetical protein